MDRNQNMSKNKHENQEKSLRQGHWWNTEWKEWRHVFMYTNRNKYKKEFLTFKFIFTLYAWVLNISSEAGLAKDLLKMMGYDGIYEVQNWILTHKLFDFSCCILFICHILMWYIRYIYRMNKYIHISFGQSVSQSHSHSVTQSLNHYYSFIFRKSRGHVSQGSFWIPSFVKSISGGYSDEDLLLSTGARLSEWLTAAQLLIAAS
jgi:hypothetical protein